MTAASASTPDLSAYAPKASPAFTGSISMGRQAETTVGLRSIAAGNNAAATGSYSGAIGNYTVAGGNGAVAVGNKSEASGDNSFASGAQTIANHRSQVAIGEYNIQDPNTNYTGRGTYAEIVGNGTSNSARSNARTLDWSGNEWLAGSLTLGSTTLTEAKLQALLSLASGGLNGTTWLLNATPTAPSQTITVTNASGLFAYDAYNTQYTISISNDNGDAVVTYYDQYGDRTAYAYGQWSTQECRTITFVGDIDTASPSVQAFLDWLHANATQQ